MSLETDDPITEDCEAVGLVPLVLTEPLAVVANALDFTDSGVWTGRLPLSSRANQFRFFVERNATPGRDGLQICNSDFGDFHTMLRMSMKAPPAVGARRITVRALSVEYHFPDFANSVSETETTTLDVSLVSEFKADGYFTPNPASINGGFPVFGGGSWTATLGDTGFHSTVTFFTTQIFTDDSAFSCFGAFDNGYQEQTPSSVVINHISLPVVVSVTPLRVRQQSYAATFLVP